jgi:hypothetical protein
MKWLRFISDLLNVILGFFGKKKEPETVETVNKHREEIDERVESADDDELVDIGIDSGLLQRPDDSSRITSGAVDEDRNNSSGPEKFRSRFKSGKHIIGEE